MDETPPETLAGIFEGLERATSDDVRALTSLARDRLVAAQADIQKGLVAFNGAGLVAVISLIKSQIASPYLHVSVWFFFAGLGFGVASWLFELRYMSLLFRLPQLFLSLRTFLSTSAHGERKLTELYPTAEALEAAAERAKQKVTEVTSKIRSKGTPITIATYGACACFALGALVLVLGFELGT